MTAVKITYLILSLISELSFLGLAVAAPIWITPGYYWWTIFGIVMMFANSTGFSKRVNSWGDLGHYE